MPHATRPQKATNEIIWQWAYHVICFHFIHLFTLFSTFSWSLFHSFAYCSFCSHPTRNEKKISYRTQMNDISWRSRSFEAASNRITQMWKLLSCQQFSFSSIVLDIGFSAEFLLLLLWCSCCNIAQKCHNLMRCAIYVFQQFSWISSMWIFSSRRIWNVVIKNDHLNAFDIRQPKMAQQAYKSSPFIRKIQWENANRAPGPSGI